MAEEVRIDLKSTADTSGFDKMGAASEKAGVGIGAASKESKAMAQELGRSVEVGNAASTMVQNLAASTKGGAAGFLSMARGAFGAGVALKGVLASLGPFGAIAAGVGIALGLITAALRKNEEAAEAQQKKLEELNKQKLDAAVKEQERYRDAADESLKKIDAEYASLSRLADAKLAYDKSAIDAAVTLDKLSKEDGERKKRALDRQREDDKRAATLGAEEAKAQKLDEIASEAERRTGAATSALGAGTSALDALKKAQDAADKIVGGPTTDFLPEYSKENIALENARNAAAPYDKSTMERLKAEADGAKKLADDLRKQAAQAREAADRERAAQRAEDPFRTGSRANEDAITAAESPAAKARLEEARKKQVEEMQRAPESTWRGRAASGFPVDSDVFKDAFPNAKPLPKPRTDLQPVTDGLNKAADAAEKAPDPKPAADAAARLASATEISAQAQASANEAVVGALSAAVAVSGQSVAAVSALTTRVIQMQSQISTLSSQLAAARQRIA